MPTRDEMIARRREKVEQYLSCNMSASAWCALNHVKSSTFYDWLAYFRDNDPDVFGGYEIAHAGDGKRYWFQEVRKAMAGSVAIVSTGGGAGFEVVDAGSVLAGSPERAQAPARAGGAVVTVRFSGVEVDVPAGCAGAIESVIKAAVSL